MFYKGKHFNTKQRFTIKKYSFGAASVLIGTFFAVAGQPAHAEEVTADVTSAQVSSDTSNTATTGENTVAETPVVSVESQEQPKEEVAPVEPVSEKVDTRTAATTYKVNYTDVASQDVVYSENKSANTQTTAPVTEKAEIKVTEKANLSAPALAGYELASGQKETVEASVFEKNAKNNVVNFNVVKVATEVKPPVAEERPKFFSATDNAVNQPVGGLIVNAEGKITQDNTTEPRATISVEVKIPNDTYKPGDVLEVRFENLTVGTKLSPIYYLTTTDEKFTFAKLEVESGTLLNPEKVSTTTGSTASVANNTTTTLAEKMAANLQIDGGDVVYKYVFTEDVVGIEDMAFKFTIDAGIIDVPKVSRTAELVGKVFVDNQEVLTLPYTIAPETEVNGTTGPITAGNGGFINLDANGNITSIESTVLINTGDHSLPVGSKIELTLDDPAFSQYVSTGPTTPFDIYVRGKSPLVDNGNGVLLPTTGGILTKLKVAGVTDTKLTLEVVEGELLANSGYQFWLNGNNPDKGARRVFSTDTLDKIKAAVAAKQRVIASTNKAEVSGPVVAKDGSVDVRLNNNTQWALRYLENIDASSIGRQKRVEGQVAMNFVDVNTGNALIDPVSVVNVNVGALSGTLKGSFKATEPAKDFNDKATPTTPKFYYNNTGTDTSPNVETKAPYIVQGTDGKTYQFVGYATQSGYENTKVSGPVTVDQANIVAQYAELKYGTVRVRYLDTRGNTLKNAVVTSYNGRPDATFKNAVGQPYDITGEKPVTDRPEKITANGFTYYLVKEPTNLTGNLPADIVNADYVYELGQVANIVFKKEGATDALSTVKEEGASSSAITTTQYDTELAKYLSQGYEVVPGKDAFAASNKTFDADSGVDQEFVIELRERVIDVTDPNDPNLPQDIKDKLEVLKEEVNQTVKYTKTTDNSEAAPTVTDKVEFTRTATVNLVTKEITYGPWTAVNNDSTFDVKKSPIVEGFLADKAEVPAKDGVTATDADVNEEVKYRPIGKFIVTNPDGSTTETPYKNDPTDPTAIDPNDKPTIPYIPGYTPKDGNGQPLQPVDPNDPTKGYVAPPAPTDGGENTPIRYEADDQKATIVFEDEAGKNLGTVNETGKTATPISKDAYKAELDELIKQGYEVVTDEFAGDVTYDDKVAEDQNFKVVLKERVVPISPDAQPGQPVDPNNPNGPVWPDTIKNVAVKEEVVRTISYVNDKGETVSVNVEQKLGFYRPMTINLVNLVTKEVIEGAWTADTTDTFEEVKSPVIPGYLADKATVPSKSGVTATDADLNEVVTYKPVPKVVITNPDGSVTEVPYKNDPTDPTKIDPNDKPIIPFVPGYIPTDGNGKPLQPVDPNDPTKGYVAPPTSGNPGDTTPVNYVPTNSTTYTPIVGEVEVPQGTPITENDITSKVTIPGLSLDTPGLSIKVKDPSSIPGTGTPGHKGTVTVVITYPDGSTEEVEVPVNVTPKAQPGTKTEAATPVAKETKEEEATLPKTGSESNSALLLGLGLLAGSFGLVGKRYKKKK